ncbi:hypothetical protein LEP1GSC163_2343 [Leptospira santarosai str. CBC379]|nr:hypothetical protein LEP1GSC163_2343 [Leptospira santarosai str. CBC379]
MRFLHRGVISQTSPNFLRGASTGLSIPLTSSNQSKEECLEPDCRFLDKTSGSDNVSIPSKRGQFHFQIGRRNIKRD